MVISVLEPLLPVSVHQMHGSRWWLTLADWRVSLRVDGSPHTITIPAGYRYDRASIPTVAGIIVTKDSLGCAGPLVHDALYQSDGWPAGLGRECGRSPAPWPTCDPWRTFSRATTDEIFRAVMIADGVEPWRARLAYYAVRLFARRW